MGSFGEKVMGSVPGLGDLFGYGVNHYEANRQMHFQEDEASKARLFNSEEAAKSRQFQQSLYNQQIAENRSLISEERAYNTPAMQVQRLQEGGINPAVYFGSQGIAKGGQVTGSVPSPSSVPQASSSAMGGTVQIPSLNFGDSFKNIAEGLNLISRTKTENVMRDPLFQKAMEDVLGQKLANKSLQILNYVNDNIKDVKIKREFQALANDIANEGLTTSEKELNEAKARTEATIQRLNGRLAMKTNTEYLILKNELGAWKQTYDAEMAVRRSEVQKNKAQANEANQAAKNQAAQAKVNNAIALIKNEEAKFTNEQMRWQINTLRNENAISENQKLISEAAAAQAEYEKDHQALLFWKNFICDVLQTGIGAFATYRNSAAFLNLSKSSKEEVSRKMQEMQLKYGEVHEFETNSSGFSKQKSTYHTPRQ